MPPKRVAKIRPKWYTKNRDKVLYSLEAIRLALFLACAGVDFWLPFFVDTPRDYMLWLLFINAVFNSVWSGLGLWRNRPWWRARFSGFLCLSICIFLLVFSSAFLALCIQTLSKTVRPTSTNSQEDKDKMKKWKGTVASVVVNILVFVLDWALVLSAVYEYGTECAIQEAGFEGMTGLDEIIRPDPPEEPRRQSNSDNWHQTMIRNQNPTDPTSRRLQST